MLVLKEFYTVFKYYINHCLILKNNNALSKKIPTRSTNSTFVTFSGDFTEKSRLFSLDNKRQTAPIVVDIFQPIRKGQKYTRVYKGAIFTLQHQLQFRKNKMYQMLMLMVVLNVVPVSWDEHVTSQVILDKTEWVWVVNEKWNKWNIGTISRFLRMSQVMIMTSSKQKIIYMYQKWSHWRNKRKYIIHVSWINKRTFTYYMAVHSLIVIDLGELCGIEQWTPHGLLL